MPADTPLPRSWLLRSLEIETDPDASSRQQVRNVLVAMREAAEDLRSSGETAMNSQRQLSFYVERLRRGIPDSPLLNYWLARSTARVDQGPDVVVADVEAGLRELERIQGQIVRAGEALFPPGQRMLTLGHSDVVLKMLEAYGDRLESITISEGRPRSSGARLARDVAALGLPVRLITEAQLGLYLPDVAVAVASARSILADGTVVARVGTSVVAHLCASHSIPFYVMADQARWTPEGSETGRFVRVRRSPAEVYSGTDPGILVSNVAYDATPPSLVTGYVTEDGIQRAATIRNAPDPTDDERVPV